MKPFKLIFLGVIFLIFYSCNNAENKIETPQRAKASFRLEDVIEKQNSANSFSAIRLGNGYNSILQEEVGRAIKYDSIVATSGDAQGPVQMHAFADIATSYLDLAKKSDLTISANFKLFGFKVNTNSNFFKSFRFNSKSQYLYAECLIETPSKELSNYVLNAEARQVAQNSINDFFQRYGDEFVVKEHRGGRLRLVYEFKSANSIEEERNSHDISIAKRFFNSQMNVEGKYRDEYKRIEENQNVRMYLMKNGGDYDSIPVITFDSLMSYYRGFPTTVKPGSGHETVLSVETKSYRSADSNATNITTLGTVVDQGTKFIDALNTRLCRLYESFGNINYLKENRLDYEKKIADSLISLQSIVEREIRETVDIYDTYVNTVSQTYTADQIRSKQLTYVTIPETTGDEFLPTYKFGTEAELDKIYLGKIVTPRIVNLILRGRLQLFNNTQPYNQFVFNPSFESDFKNKFGSHLTTFSYAGWARLYSPRITPIHIYLHDFFTNKRISEFVYTDENSVKIEPGRYIIYVKFDTKGQLIDPSPGNPWWHLTGGPFVAYEETVVNIPQGELINVEFK